MLGRGGDTCAGGGRGDWGVDGAVGKGLGGGCSAGGLLGLCAAAVISLVVIGAPEIKELVF